MVRPLKTFFISSSNETFGLELFSTAPHPVFSTHNSVKAVYSKWKYHKALTDVMFDCTCTWTVLFRNWPCGYMLNGISQSESICGINIDECLTFLMRANQLLHAKYTTNCHIFIARVRWYCMMWLCRCWLFLYSGRDAAKWVLFCCNSSFR